MIPNFKIHPFAEANSTEWSGGKTTELFIFPKSSSYQNRDFEFRISSATIEVEESDFTSLPDYNRWLAVLEGELEIIHEGKYSKQLSALESDSFHGSWKTSSKGKVRDLNVIHADKFKLESSCALFHDPTVIHKTSDFLFLLVLSDSMKLQRHPLQKYDLVEVVADELKLEAGLSCFVIELSRI